MRSAPIANRRDISKAEATAAPARSPGGAASRAGAFLWREFREIVPPTIFFFVGFNLIVLTTNLILADYGEQFATFMIAEIGCRRPSRIPCQKLDGVPIHAHGPNGVLLRALGPVPHQGVRGLAGPPGGG